MNVLAKTILSNNSLLMNNPVTVNIDLHIFDFIIIYSYWYAIYVHAL